MSAEQEIYRYSPIVSRIRQEVMAEAKASEHIEKWFLPDHLLEVERSANWLCDLYSEADRDVVGLGVWLHDIGRLRGRDDDHDVYGAEEARKILAETAFPPEKIELIYEVCRSHRCKDVQPQSLEAKILATADAMSHFTHGFYFRLFDHYKDKMNFDELLILIRKKLERDFGQKMFFEEAREKIKGQYQAWKVVLNPTS